MLEVTRLLRFTPDEAVLMMVNQERNTHLRPEIAEVGIPVSLGGLRTKVDVFSTDRHPEMIQNPYSGTAQLLYNRYSLNETFGYLLLNMKPPATVNSILQYVTEKTGIVFTEDDFDNIVIDTQQFTLPAKPTSKRWVGEVEIFLDAANSGTHISQWLSINDHQGLVIDVKEFIWDAAPNDILDGFVLNKPDIGIYLRKNDHLWLEKDSKPGIETYYASSDHEGLQFTRIDTALPVNDHSGLYITPDEGLLTVGGGVTQFDGYDL